MRKVFCLAILLLLVACGNEKISGVSSGPARNAGAEPGVTLPKPDLRGILAEAGRGRYREGELLVKFRPDTETSSVNRATGSRMIRSFQALNAELVRLPEGVSVSEAISQYMKDPRVEFAEPNYIKCLKSTSPNDLYFNPQQWALQNTGTFANGTVGADIGATQSWDIIRGNSGMTVAVIDTGIDYNHHDLVNNLWKNNGENECNDGFDNDQNGYVDDCRGWDFVNTDNDPIDDNGHGTHVAGIIGAAGNNGVGTSGVMWNVKIMPLKVFSAKGEADSLCDGVSGTVADEVAAVQYAVANGARIINASFGGNEFCNTELIALSAANDAGVLVVAAAGNENANNDLVPVYPAGYELPNVISVAATDQNDRIASFSNFGFNSVDVAAPGVYILSTITPGLTFSLCTGSQFVGYDFCSGTSMAAPHVTGLAGLLFSNYPGFTLPQIRSTILRYVDPLPSLQGWVQTGGRINAYKALSSLLPPSGLTAKNKSQSSITVSWTDNANGEDGYRIERKEANGEFALLSQVLGPNSTSFTDTGLVASTTYTYRVRAFNSIPANSAYSNEASAVPAHVSDSGGGGCSIGPRQNGGSAFANAAMMLMPVLVVIVLRRARRKRK